MAWYIASDSNSFLPTALGRKCCTAKNNDLIHQCQSWEDQGYHANSESWAPSTVSPSLTSSCSLCSSGWELRGSWCCRPNNFRNSSQQTGIGGLKTNLHMHFYFQSLFMHSNKKMKRVTEMKINRLIYLLALNSLSYC